MGTMRTFVAVELDDTLKRALRQVQDGLAASVPARTVRWIQAGGIHITLKFLGDVPERQITAIQAGLGRAARGSAPFAFSVGRLGCFPDARRPSVIWVGLEEPTGALAHVQKAVEAQLSPLGYPPEDRLFRPHLTLGRVDRGAALPDLRRLRDVITATQVGELGVVRVTGISLMKSDLQPGGSVYIRLSWVALGPANEP